MIKEEPYIKIETYIRKTVYGMIRTDKLIAKSSNMPEAFMKILWDKYRINMDDLK